MTDGKPSGVLPNFLIIGAMRSGTSWLANLLQSHEHVYMSSVEVHFFDANFHKGIQWYRAFFPDAEEAGRYSAAGEKTPEYLCDPAVPSRVADHLPECRFLVILRNPVRRAFSHYKNSRQYGSHKLSFSDYLDEHPEALRRGQYATQIKRWLRYFPKEKFLFLVFEEATRDPARVYDQLSEFLEIDARGFREDAAFRRVNASYMPRFHSVYRLGSRLNDFLVDKECYTLSRMVVSAGRMFRFLGARRGAEPVLDDDTRQMLRGRYEGEVRELERILGRDFQVWGY